MSKILAEQDIAILKEKIVEMEKSLIEVEKLIDDAKKQCEKEAIKALEVFRLTTVQEIERTKMKIENLSKKNN
jgi:hypothetical protein